MGFGPFEWIGVDADDTLWHSERHFQALTQTFLDVVSPYVLGRNESATWIHDELIRVETENVASFGFGIKGAVLSMMQLAIQCSDGAISGAELMRLIDGGREMMEHPIELLEGVVEGLERSGDASLIMITKGDLIDQRRKIADSGLERCFQVVEITADKTRSVYAEILHRHGIHPDRFVMIGNSVASDILPALATGASAIHVPHELEWAYERAETPVGHPRFRTAPTFAHAVQLARGGLL